MNIADWYSFNADALKLFEESPLVNLLPESSQKALADGMLGIDDVLKIIMPQVNESIERMITETSFE